MVFIEVSSRRERKKVKKNDMIAALCKHKGCGQKIMKVNSVSTVGGISVTHVCEVMPPGMRKLITRRINMEKEISVH